MSFNQFIDNEDKTNLSSQLLDVTEILESTKETSMNYLSDLEMNIEDLQEQAPVVGTKKDTKKFR